MTQPNVELKRSVMRDRSMKMTKSGHHRWVPALVVALPVALLSACGPFASAATPRTVAQAPTAVPTPAEVTSIDAEHEPVWRTEVVEDRLAAGDPDSDTFLDTRLQYPIIESAAAGIDVRTINELIEGYVGGLKRDWVEGALQIVQVSDQSLSAYEVGYEMTLIAADLVSIRFDYYDYVCCRPYPNLGQRTLTIDLATGQEVDVATIVAPAFHDTVRSLVIDEIGADYELDSGEIERLQAENIESPLDLRSVGLRPEGLEVGTDRGQLLAPVFPPTTTILTWAKLGDMVNPDLRARTQTGRSEWTPEPGVG